MSITVNGTNGLTFNDGSAQNTAATGFGFKNRIINGAMMIDQRNAGNSVTITSNYTLDRWKADNSTDGTLTAQQVIDAPAGLYNSLKVTVGTADTVVGAAQYAQALQIIEGSNIADLGWGASGASTVTLSFWVKSSTTGLYGGVILNSALNRSYVFSYNINSANTWEQKTITITGDVSGTWLKTNGAGIGVYFNLMCGSTYQGATGSWSGSTLLAPTGQTNLLATSGNTWQITGVQLEKGSTATSFDYRPYGTELALCQRYYEASFPYGTTVANYAGNNNSSNVRAMYVGSASGSMGWSHDWKVPKRASPIVTVYRAGSPYTAGQLDNAGTGVAATVSNIGTHSAFIYAAGNNMYFNFTVEAEL